MYWGEEEEGVEEDVDEDKKGRREQGKGDGDVELDSASALKEKETLMLPSRSKIVRIGGREGQGDLTSIDTLLDGDLGLNVADDDDDADVLPGNADLFRRSSKNAPQTAEEEGGTYRNWEINKRAVHVLSMDLQRSEALVQRLMDEANDKAQTLRTSAQMIASLKADREVLLDDIDRLRGDAEEIRKRLEKLRGDQSKIAHEALRAAQVAREELMKEAEQSPILAMKLKIKELQAAIKHKQEESKEAEKRLQQTREQIGRYSLTLEQREWMKQSDRAVITQKLYIEKLTAENKVLEELKAKVQRNENVTAVLERRITEKEPLGASTKRERELNQINPRTGFRMRELREQVSKLRQYNRRLESLLRAKESESNIFLWENYGSGGREKRAKILEKQLIENATKFANEISQLKLRIFEIEVGSLQ